MPTITKHNYKKLSRRNLLPDEYNQVAPKDEQQLTDNQYNLQEYKKMWDAYDQVRRMHDRCCDYINGDQLNGRIKDPDGFGEITEKDYLIREGYPPLVVNIIDGKITSIAGKFAETRLDSLCVARSRINQQAGEMMTCAMQYVAEQTYLWNKKTDNYRNLLIDAWIAFRVGYGWDEERHIHDIYCDVLDIKRLFTDNNTSGLYFENIQTVGYLHDLPIERIISNFANNETERRRIEAIYKTDTELNLRDEAFERGTKVLDFYRSNTKNLCRVIEVWQKELRRKIYAHDILKGEEYLLDPSEEANIQAENANRIAQIIEAGGKAEDAALIEYMPKTSTVWTVRYFTPQGYILHQEESPYWHDSHPFIIGAYPMMNGEIHSKVERLIPEQRLINRVSQRIENQRMNDNKGTLIYDTNSLGNLSPKEIQDAYTRPGSVIGMDLKEGVQKPFILSPSNAGITADVQLLQLHMQNMDDISGAHSALQGKEAKSGVAASLYAQQTANSNINLIELQEWYKGLLQKLDTKIVRLMQQYYTEDRYINIAGKEFSEEAKHYSAVLLHDRELLFDVSIIESKSSGLLRTQNEEVLLNLLMNGIISKKEWLAATSLPYADKLAQVAEQVEQEQAAAAQQQQTMQQQAAMQQVQPQQSIQ